MLGEKHGSVHLACQADSLRSETILLRAFALLVKALETSKVEEQGALHSKFPYIDWEKGWAHVLSCVIACAAAQRSCWMKHGVPLTVMARG